MKTARKLISALLVAITIIGVAPITQFDKTDFLSMTATAMEIEKIDSIKILSLPNKTKYYAGLDATKFTYTDYEYDELGNYTEVEYEYYDCGINRDGMELEITYNNGQTFVTDASYVYEEDTETWYSFNIYQIADNGNSNEWQMGENIVNVEFMGKTASFTVILLENPIRNVEFTKLNLKDSYMQNELFNIYGSEIEVCYKDGQSEKFIIGEYYDYAFLESKVLNENYYGYFSIDEEASKAIFSCFGFSFEIPFKRSSVSVIGLGFINEPISYNAVGSDVILKYSDGTSQAATILDFDTRAGGAEDCIREKGFVRTTAGMFDGWFSIYNFRNQENIIYKFGIGSTDIDDENSYEGSIDEKAVLGYLSKELLISTYYYSWTYNYSLDNEVYYDGEVNENNFDLLLFISNFVLSANFEKNTFNAEEISKLIPSIFDEDEVDIKLSKYYDEASEKVVFPQFYGAGGEFHNEIKVEKINDVVYIEIQLSVGDNESKTYCFRYRNNICTYFGRVEDKAPDSDLISEINSVKISDVSLDYKSSYTIIPKVVADDGAEYTVSYSSDSKNVTVDENGKIYGAKKGTANITVTVTDSQGSIVTDTCKVTVEYTWWQWIIKIVLFGWIWY